MDQNSQCSNNTPYCSQNGCSIADSMLLITQPVILNPSPCNSSIDVPIPQFQFSCSYYSNLLNFLNLYPDGANSILTIYDCKENVIHALVKATLGQNGIQLSIIYVLYRNRLLQLKTYLLQINPGLYAISSLFPASAYPPIEILNFYFCKFANLPLGSYKGCGVYLNSCNYTPICAKDFCIENLSEISEDPDNPTVIKLIIPQSNAVQSSSYSIPVKQLFTGLVENYANNLISEYVPDYLQDIVKVWYGNQSKRLLTTFVPAYVQNQTFSYKCIDLLVYKETFDLCNSILYVKTNCGPVCLLRYATLYQNEKCNGLEPCKPQQCDPSPCKPALLNDKCGVPCQNPSTANQPWSS